uniref:Lysosomal Pro-X carboxypeptidase n=1 Tax=Tetranychus truncatus TaxID=93132 RepID=A0A3G5ANT4_9ACAR|nr:lysosomal Pro-X carboxypeptidase isoform X2 [Tetranychus truncatus]
MIYLKLFGLTLLFSLVSTFSTPIPANYTVFWYQQKVDHFNYINNDTFQQRVIISTDHWCTDGCPIFFYAGNEGDVFSFANNTGFMWENAPRFKAMVIFAEHRYYGESLPYGDKSFASLDKLGFLSVEQALADFAELIQEIKVSYPAARKSPVVMFGGSYGGMLAAWFRIKYPHLIVGALAASAPILQFPGLYDCNGYNSIVTKSFRSYSEQCYLSIKNSWDAIQRVGSNGVGLRWISDNFNLCKPLSNSSDLNDFSSWLQDTFGSLAMIDYPNPADFLEPLPAYPIGVLCSKLPDSTKQDKPLLVDLFHAISVYYNYSGQRSCFDYRDNSEGGRLGGDGWGFQSCTEMVLPICSTLNDSMFPQATWDLSQVKADCIKTYGVAPEESKALWLFGGENIASATNIIFSNGARDPWSAGGVLKTYAETLPAIIIEGACHHEDLRSTGPNDPIPLIRARQREIIIMKDWIDKYYQSINHWPAEWSRDSNLI